MKFGKIKYLTELYGSGEIIIRVAIEVNCGPDFCFNNYISVSPVPDILSFISVFDTKSTFSTLFKQPFTF